MPVSRVSVFTLTTLCILLIYAVPVAVAQNPLSDTTTLENSHIFSNPSPMPLPSFPADIPVFGASAIQRQIPEIESSPLVTYAVPDLVQAFASHFIQNIEAEPELKNAFAICRFTEQQFRNIMFNIALNAHSAINYAKPDDSALLLSNVVGENFGRATTESFIKILAYSTGKYIYAQGLLTPENVLNYSQMYFDKMKEAITSVVNHTPEADLMAIAAGYFSFLNFYGLFTLDNVDLLDTIVAQEWYKW